MRDLLADLERFAATGRRCVVARVVGVDGSSPRDVGAAMAVAVDGEVAGAVSGGCVESAVITAATDLLDGGAAGVESFGYSDEDAFAVGLACGGTVHLLLAPWNPDGPVHADLRRSLERDEPAVLAAVVRGPQTGAHLVVTADGHSAGSLGDAELDRVVARDARGVLDEGRTVQRRYGPCGEAQGVEAAADEVEVLLEAFAPPPRLLVVGAVDFSAALARVGRLLGFRVVVCDPRAVFATEQRLPDADEVVVDWPQRVVERLDPPLGRRDAVCVLTHEHRFDVPAIVAALATDVGYLGAMGSRRTQAERVELLRAEGVDDAGLARLRAPIGLDLGARTPEETAVAIAAEIIAVRTGAADVAPLRDGDGPIHRR